jgi:GT2 family glycosyltransferase
MNTTAPMVSVIIVSWNAREYLRQCLASLTPDACRYPMEIIVVDNASHDGSPDVVTKEFPHVRLIQTGANLGFAKANNIGIAASTGRREGAQRLHHAPRRLLREKSPGGNGRTSHHWR